MPQSRTDVCKDLQKAIEDVLANGVSRFEDLEFTLSSVDIVPVKLQIYQEYHEFILVQQFDPDRVRKALKKSLTKPDDTMRNSDESELIESVARESVASELGGSPLKMRKIADLSIDDDDNFASRKKSSACNPYSPVSTRDARRLLSLLSLARCTLSDCVIGLNCPLFVLCNGECKQKIAFMSYECIPSDGFTQVVTTGTLSGPKIVNDIGNINDVKQSRGKVSCYALYKVVESYNNDSVFSENESLTIELEWNKPTKYLAPPPEDTHVDVKVSVVPVLDDVKSPIFSFYEELDFLARLLQACNSGEMTWGCHSNTKEDGDVHESLRLCFHELKRGDACVRADVTDASADDKFAQRLFVHKRHDCDFTDMLWNILIQCRSYSELEKCLQFTFKELKSGDLQPRVNVYNATTMATVVKESFSGKFFIPSFLSQEKTTELLIEIGVHKLRSDYISIMISNDLATLNDTKDLIDSNKSLSVQYENVRKLHNLLEVIFLLDTYLRIPHEIAVSCVREILKFYENNDVSPTEYHVKIPINNIKELLQKSSPFVWSSSKLGDGIGNVKIMSAVYFSMESPMDHVKIHKPDAVSESLDYVVLTVDQSITSV